MSERHVLTTEIGAALGILGLLLVFLPLFLQRATQKMGVAGTARERMTWIILSWALPGLIALAGVDATLGLLTLWGIVDCAKITGWVLLALIWLVVCTSFVTVQKVL